MTLRERIADWISGGALSRARNDIDYFQASRDRWRQVACSMGRAYDNAQDRISAAIAEVSRQKHPNAVVRRIGKILVGAQ